MHANTSWSTWPRCGELHCTGIASRRRLFRAPPVTPYTPPTGLRSHTEMIDQVTNLEDGELALPTSSLDLSTRMRDLRARQGLKQSEVARRMGLDPSIPSLWEQGKRLVPANRVRALAEALEVTVEELLEGISGATRPSKPISEGALRAGVAELIDERAAAGCQRVAETGPLLRRLPR